MKKLIIAAVLLLLLCCILAAAIFFAKGGHLTPTSFTEVMQDKQKFVQIFGAYGDGLVYKVISPTAVLVTSKGTPLNATLNEEQMIVVQFQKPHDIKVGDVIVVTGFIRCKTEQVDDGVPFAYCWLDARSVKVMGK